jgi:hypothetical protein
MSFRNLFFQLAEIRDHNFCDFLDQLEKVDEEFLQAKFCEGYNGHIEPYFDPIIPLTLHPTSCDAFFRVYPQWPITPRDYYLSKLFQFLYQPIEIRYKVDYRTEGDVRKQLEIILDRVPDGVMAHLHQWDWWDFFDDTCKLDLKEVLESVTSRLDEFCKRTGEGSPPQESTQAKPRRRRRSKTEQRDSMIVSCLSRDLTRAETCQILDDKGIETTRGMKESNVHKWMIAFSDPEFHNNVQQIMSKALKKPQPVKS